MRTPAVTFLFLMMLVALKSFCTTQTACPKMCSCDLDTKYSSEGDNNSLKVNCSDLGLSALPENIPPQTTYLLFDHNSLTHLQNYTFSHLKALKCLNLSSNMISSLEEESFADLTELQYLQLDNNWLELSPRTYPPLVFKPLISLRSLLIGNNTHSASLINDQSERHAPVASPLSPSLLSRTVNQSKHIVYMSAAENNADISDETRMLLSLNYPDKALSYLSNLEELFIDGLINKSFGSGFKQLRKLTFLFMAGKPTGFCVIDTLTNKTFVNIPSLHDLYMLDCGIKIIEPDAFGALPNLTELTLSHNSLGLSKMFDAFYGLTKTRLKELYISNIVPFGAPGQTITQENLRFFRNLTHLRILHARSNRIVNFEVGALCSGIPPNLTTVNLGLNWLELTYYIHDLQCLQTLEKLMVDGLDFECPQLRVPDVTQDRTNTDCRRSAVQTVTDKNRKMNDPQEFVLPPNLKNMSVANMGLYYILGKIRVNSVNSLQFLDASGNSFRVWRGPVTGLEKLTVLNMSNSLGSEINPHFFESFYSLQILNISENNLRKVFHDDTEGTFLRSLKNLEILDLSKNDLGSLHNNSFYGLDNIKELYLSQNRLETVNVSLKHMTNLRVLDLHNNLLNFLPQNLCDHLDNLTERHNVNVNIFYNPISCTCFNIEFLRWISKSRVKFGTNETFRCLYEDGSQTYISKQDMWSIIERLEQTCGGNVGAFFASGALFLSLMTSVALALAYRFRWKLRYLYYATRLNFQRQRQSADDEFDFDAFVSFSSEDNDFVMGELRRRLEDDRDVTLCIHTRDFTPGQFIATNVVDCIQRSRRTLVVVTRALLESDWCHYELQMALMEASHTGRHVLVFLLYEHLSSHEIPRQVLYNIQAATHIEFPHEEEDTSLFWNRLILALKA